MIFFYRVRFFYLPKAAFLMITCCVQSIRLPIQSFWSVFSFFLFLCTLADNCLVCAVHSGQIEQNEKRNDKSSAALKAPRKRRISLSSAIIIYDQRKEEKEEEY